MTITSHYYIRGMNYGGIDHYHCWVQQQPPACGIPLEKHEQCCLCDLSVPR
jgi:hypothetical protein